VADSTTTPDFWSPQEVSRRLEGFVLDSSLLASIAALPLRQRKPALAYAERMEWHKCASDILYWLTPGLHFTSPAFPGGTPYVYTQERKALFQCVACSDGALYDVKRQPIHLKFRHNLEYSAYKDIAAMFSEMDRSRVFNLLSYMPPIIEWWQREPVMLIEKSRDMMATWLAVTCYAWDTLFHRNKQNCFQSLTATKTCEAVQRVFFIWQNQPAFLKRQHKVEFAATTTKSGLLSIPSLGSEIIGLPRGADQIRQYHPSGVFSDEAAFQIEAGAMYQAIRPSIMNGGRYTAVSSANPGWFQMAAQDRLEEA
jgi:hypothetical protein